MYIFQKSRETRNINNDEEEDFDVDVDSESLDEQSLAVAIKGDAGNQANLMITNLYKMNAPANQATRTSPIHLNTSSMGGASGAIASTSSSGSSPKEKKNSTTIKKEVRFEANFEEAPSLSSESSDARKRKSAQDIESNNQAKTSKSDTTLLNGSDRAKNDIESDFNKSKKSSSKKCKIRLINFIHEIFFFLL